MAINKIVTLPIIRVERYRPPTAVKDLEVLVRRLRRHANDFELTDGESQKPGKVAFDLNQAADVISQIIAQTPR